MRSPTRRALLATTATALAGLAGCTDTGGDGASPTPEPTPIPTPSPPPTPQPTVVGATCSSTGGHYRFAPPVVSIEVGETVRWSGASRCKQQVLAYHPDTDAPLRIPEGAASWESPVMKQGEAFSHTFETPGVYNYYGLYEQFGQVGVVVVGDPAVDPSTQPGLTRPGESVPAEARTRLLELIGEVEAELSG